jgi:hypothetical protein
MLLNSELVYLLPISQPIAAPVNAIREGLLLGALSLLVMLPTNAVARRLCGTSAWGLVGSGIGAAMFARLALAFIQPLGSAAGPSWDGYAWILLIVFGLVLGALLPQMVKRSPAVSLTSASSRRGESSYYERHRRAAEAQRR